MKIPEKVILTEVGMRDGFQFETRVVPTQLKIKIINRLAQAGLAFIQIASFVNPKLVPQMADADRLLQYLPPESKNQKNKNPVCTALVLNPKGVQRAFEAGFSHVEISVSASETHGRKNTGMSLVQAIESGKKMIEMAENFEMSIILSIQCAFGCVYDGHVPFERVINMVETFLGSAVNSSIARISLADTTGMATPVMVTDSIKRLTLQINEIPTGLHLHDTRGLGLVNLMAALECGVAYFDTSFAGMGGCPFVKGAAGNISTEDTAWLLKTLGIETNVDIFQIAECSRRMEVFFDKTFPGKIHKITDYLKTNPLLNKDRHISTGTGS
ncbi:hydroxymethylglutaryl-CoA lyase [Desulfobacterales bacterium HSG16]|nr:hydroxymethylglutaryl-CoA lyase [Desulfobacterales bacterium HSG16]